MKTVTLTHKGWVGICPVLLAIDHEYDAMFLEPRWPWLGWLLTVSLWLQQLSGVILDAIHFDYEPGFCAHGVRELQNPVVMQLEP